VFDAQCITYTGADIECNDDVVVEQNTSVADALDSIVQYFCTAGGELLQLIENLPTTAVAAGAGIQVTSTTVGTLTTYTVTNTGVKKYTNSGNYPAGVPTNVIHNLNTTFVTVSLVSSSGLPYTSYIHGTDYTYTIIDNNTISLTFTLGGFANVTVIG